MNDRHFKSLFAFTPRLSKTLWKRSCGCAAGCAVAALPHRAWHLIIPGLRPRGWGVAPDSISSSRKGAALPHIGRHGREPRLHRLSKAGE